MTAGPTSLMVLGIQPAEDMEEDVPPWRWWLETAIVGVLAAGAIAGPLVFGGTPTSARTGLDLLVAAAAVAWIVSAPRSGWLAWAPVAAAAAVVLQLVPLPLSLLEWVAPPSASAWRSAGGETVPGWGTISVDPGVTAEGIRRLLLGMAAVVVTADLCRDVRRRLLLAAAIALAGVVVWVLGLAYPTNGDHVLLGRFDLRGPEKRVWWCTTVMPPVRTAGFAESSKSGFVPVGDSRYYLQRWSIGDGMGSYVVSNHFAAGIYLTIPILLGLCRTRWRGPVWGWGGAALSLVVFAAATWTVGLQARSRAGGGALLLATVVFMLLSASKPWARRGWLAALVVLGIVLVGFTLVFFGIAPGLAGILPEDLRERLQAVLRRENRLALNHVAFSILGSSPLFGTGLGTFGFVQPWLAGFEKSTFFTHNDYAQFVTETGLLGAAGLVAAVGLLAVALVRVPRLPDGERMLAAGVWAALAALALHSFYDWNLHVPANRLLASLVAGLALAIVPLVPALRAERAVVRGGGGPLPSRLADVATVPWTPRRAIAAVMLAGACLATAYLTVRDAATEYVRLRLRVALMNVRSAENDDQRGLAYGRLKWGVVRAREADRHHSTDSELPLLAAQAVLHLDAAEEGLEGQDADDWIALARSRGPLRLGLPIGADEPVPDPLGRRRTAASD